MNHAKTGAAESAGEVVVTLDCERISLPKGRASLKSVHAYLEAMALANQKILGELKVDGRPMDLSTPLTEISFQRVDAVTVPLGELPLLLLTTAGQQAERARASVESALTLVLINNAATAREIWWSIAGQLKEPVLTLSLMPEHLCQLWCGTTFQKLRRWQLEQIATIIQRVDEACNSQDSIQLSDALENLVLPWLDRLTEHIRLWHSATQAGARLGSAQATS